MTLSFVVVFFLLKETPATTLTPTTTTTANAYVTSTTTNIITSSCHSTNRVPQYNLGGRGHAGHLRLLIAQTRGARQTHFQTQSVFFLAATFAPKINLFASAIFRS